MKKLIIIPLLLWASFSNGQYDMDEAKKNEEKENKISPFELKKKIYIGGELSLRFGNVTYLYISPIAGYDITPTFSAGISTMYQLYRAKYTNGAIESYHAYGGGVFLRYRPFKPLLLQTEFDIFNTDDFEATYAARTNVPVFMAGMGYAGNLGEGAYYQIMLMYDFIDDNNMPLPQLFLNIPIYLRYGFVFHLG